MNVSTTPFVIGLLVALAAGGLLLLYVIQRRGIHVNVNAPAFVIGLLIALAAGGLLLLGVIESGPAAAIGVVGIGLIGASAIRRPDRS